MAIPIASPSAVSMASVVPTTAAPPKAKPTAKPSGTLCIVTARKSLVDLLSAECKPSSCPVPLCMCGTSLSITTRKTPPAISPIAAGRKLHLPQSAEPSIAGISSDHTDAAIIMPAANPRNSVLSLSDISFLKKNTSAAPSVVARKIIENPVIVITVLPINFTSFQENHR